MPTNPLLLRQLALAVCIVTIDAMGTQTAIAQQIVEQSARLRVKAKRLRSAWSTDYLERVLTQSS